tara:strand:- start:368 stop:547 length:180 start_codon:yes stop_codon:yes gene_type:complete
MNSKNLKFYSIEVNGDKSTLLAYALLSETMIEFAFNGPYIAWPGFNIIYCNKVRSVYQL